MTEIAAFTSQLRGRLAAVKDSNFKLQKFCRFIKDRLLEYRFGEGRKITDRPVSCEYPRCSLSKLSEIRPNESLLKLFEGEWERRAIGWPAHLNELDRLFSAVEDADQKASDALRDIPPELEKKLTAVSSDQQSEWGLRTRRLLDDLTRWCESSFLDLFVESLGEWRQVLLLKDEYERLDDRIAACSTVLKLWPETTTKHQPVQDANKRRDAACIQWRLDFGKDLLNGLTTLRDALAEVWRWTFEALTHLDGHPCDYPHRSEYPMHDPGDKRWYDDDGLRRYHYDWPEEWRRREIRWPLVLDRLVNSYQKAIQSAPLLRHVDFFEERLGKDDAAVIKRVKTESVNVLQRVLPCLDGFNDPSQDEVWSDLSRHISTLNELLEGSDVSAIGREYRDLRDAIDTSLPSIEKIVEEDRAEYSRLTVASAESITNGAQSSPESVIYRRISKSELAKLLGGISAQGLRNLMRQGRIPIRPGTAKTAKLIDVDVAWLRQYRDKSGGQN